MIKKSLMAAALALPLTAFATPIPSTFSDTSLGGSDTVAFSQLQISGGQSSVFLTDTNLNGQLDIGDSFVENGMVAGVGFTNPSHTPIPGTHLNQMGGYQLWAVFDPLVGYVSGATLASAGPVTVQSFTANFVVPSGVKIYYDTNVSDGFTAGSVVIGTATLPTTDSHCAVTQTTVAGAVSESGSCLLQFIFDAAGVAAPGVWTSGGNDVGLLAGAKLRVDMNVDNFSPTFFKPLYAGVGGTQVITLDHNGSASFVPEPASLTLMGLGLLGLGMIRRRKGIV